MILLQIQRKDLTLVAKKLASVESFHDFAWSIKREAVFKRLVVLSTPWPGTLVRETSLKP